MKVAGRGAAHDSLTSSATPGHAMAIRELGPCFGAVVGKALVGHDGDDPGTVLALVRLG